MVITRATEYAIRALLYLAKQPKGEIVFKRDICKSQKITPAFLTKILQPLIKVGIVGSQRGVGGGFYLLRDPSEFSLLDVVRAEEGELYLNVCLEKAGTCEKDFFCPAHGAWKEVQESMVTLLGGYTFARLVSQEDENLRRRQQA